MTPKILVPFMEQTMPTKDKKAVPSVSNKNNSFDMLMNRNIEKNNIQVEDKSYRNEKQNNSVQKPVSVNDNRIEVAQKGTSTSETVSGKMNDIEELTISDETISTLNQFKQLILMNVANELGISEEELLGELEAMGMNAFDLLNTENLKAFVLNLNGSNNPVDFLMNEDLTEQLNNLTSLLDKLSEEELNMTKEEVFELSEFTEQFQKMEENQNNTENNMFSQVDGDDLEVSAETPITVVKESNTSEENSSTFEDLLKNSKEGQKEELHANKHDKPVDLFIQNLSKQQNIAVDGMEQVVEQARFMKDIVNQIVEKIKIAIKPESTSMELQLNPEHLGKISLTVVEKNGEMTANFVAQNHAAKEAIESQIQTLKENLNNQGLKVEAVEVTVSEFSFKQSTDTGQGASSQENEKNKNHVNRRKIDLSLFDENSEDITEEEILRANVLKDNGGSIDYTA